VQDTTCYVYHDSELSNGTAYFGVPKRKIPLNYSSFHPKGNLLSISGMLIFSREGEGRTSSVGPVGGGLVEVRVAVARAGCGGVALIVKEDVI
jgi:hypothetical protein